MVKKSETRPFELSRYHPAYKWPISTYTVEETNNLAVAYASERDPEAKSDLSLELLKRFHSMFYKFMKLLVTGQPDLSNNYQKKFLSLFMPVGVKKNKASYTEAAGKCTIIFRQDEPDDIYNNMVLVFLQLLDGYNPSLNIGFVFYINFFFRYQLKRFMVSRYYDCLDYQYINAEDIVDCFRSEESLPEGPVDGQLLAIDNDSMFYEPELEEYLDSALSLDDTSDAGILKTLTSFEKYIVYMLVVRGYRRAALARELRISINKLNATVQTIKRKTRNLLELEIPGFSNE